MIYSNDRKRCLSGWLHQNSRAAYNTALKLQKFLLFYECFSKVSGEKADFGHLGDIREVLSLVRFGVTIPKNARRLIKRPMRATVLERP